jgi:hypothetical protein
MTALEKATDFTDCMNRPPLVGGAPVAIAETFSVDSRKFQLNTADAAPR